MKKRLLALVLSGLMVTSLLTACGGTPESTTDDGTPKSTADSKSNADSSSTPESVPKSEKIPIRFMYWNKEESMADLVKLINDTLDHVDFQFEFVDTSSFDTVFHTQMAAGEGPDILANEKPKPNQPDKGYALDLRDYDFVKLYQDSAVAEMSDSTGKVWAVPGPSWFGGYFYNKGMFDEHGWEIPKDYDEFLTLCQEIEDAGIKPIANPIKNPNYLMHYALAYVTPSFLRAEAGMEWDNKFADGETTMVGNWEPYMNEWEKVVEQGFVTEQDLGMDADQAIDEFATGKAAILDSGPWDVDTIYGKNPDMKLDMMPYVGNDANATGWLFGGPGVTFGINSKLGEAGNEEKLQACVDVIELISSPEGQLAYWQNNKGGSSYVKGVELDMPSEYDGCKEVFAQGHIYAPWAYWNTGVMDEFGKQLQGYVAGTTSIDEVLAATDAKNLEMREKILDALDQ